MAEIDRDELRRLWVERLDLSQRQIADHFRTTSGTIVRMVIRLRKLEGAKRWPNRPSPINPSPKPRSPPRVRQGAATLPPLASLE